MKKMVLAAMSVAMFGSVSYATTDYSAQALDESVVYEQEEGAMSVEDVQLLSDVQSWPRRPGPGRPGHGRPGRPEPRPVTCFAQNARGQMFRATAMDVRWAQRMALDKCERNSRFCRPAGCR